MAVRENTPKPNFATRPNFGQVNSSDDQTRVSTRKTVSGPQVGQNRGEEAGLTGLNGAGP